MSTNANVFNSRVTSEALEAKFRQVFPAQAGAELIQDLYASGVITPVIDFSSVAEGSVLSQNLQTAWDFATSNTQVRNSSNNIITTPGFWALDLVMIDDSALSGSRGDLKISDGLSTKTIYQYQTGSTTGAYIALEQQFVVFLRSGDTATIQSTDVNLYLTATYRQIADVNGNLVNPLGFTFS